MDRLTGLESALDRASGRPNSVSMRAILSTRCNAFPGVKARVISAAVMLVACNGVLWAPSAQASDCYRIQDPDERNGGLAETR